MVVVHANLFEMFFWKHISFNELSVSNIYILYLEFKTKGKVLLYFQFKPYEFVGR